MNKEREKLLFWLAAAAIVALCANFAAAALSGLSAPAAVQPFIATLAVAALLAGLRERQARLADMEREGAERDSGPARSGSIFTGGVETGAMGAERALKRFEAAAQPVFFALAAAAQIGGAWWLTRLSAGGAGASGHAAVAAFVALEALIFHAAGRYFGAEKGGPGAAWFQSPARYAGVAAAACLAAAVLCFAGAAVWPAADAWAARILAACAGVMGVESLLRLAGEVYRPRVAGVEERVFESAAAATILNPLSWARHVSEAVDYQFGFEVSRTRIYLFLARAAAPFIASQIALLYLLSCMVFLGPEEAGILERFGEPQRPELAGGFHFKLPWPIERVVRVPAKRIHTLSVELEPAGRERSGAALWSRPRYDKEEYFLTAGRLSPSEADSDSRAVPAGLLVFNAPLEYIITNVYDYTYIHRAPRDALQKIASRAVARKAAGRHLFDIIGGNLGAITSELKAEIQREADSNGLGVRILFVGATGIHPPVPVATAFESVTGALEERNERVARAQGFAAREIPLASAGAYALLRKAESFRVRRAAVAAADAALFEGVCAGSGKAPSVFKTMRTLDAVARAVARARKYVMAADPETEVVIMNFEKRIGAELFELESKATNVEAGGIQ